MVQLLTSMIWNGWGSIFHIWNISWNHSPVSSAVSSPSNQSSSVSPMHYPKATRIENVTVKRSQFPFTMAKALTIHARSRQKIAQWCHCALYVTHETIGILCGFKSRPTLGQATAVRWCASTIGSSTTVAQIHQKLRPGRTLGQAPFVLPTSIGDPLDTVHVRFRIGRGI